MIVMTVVIHAIALNKLVYVIESVAPKFYKVFNKTWKAPLMALTVLGVFLSHITQIWLFMMF